MNIDSKELEQYLTSSLSAIKQGIESKGEFRIDGPIEFDFGGNECASQGWWAENIYCQRQSQF